MIVLKGSPQSVERARFLVTEALNSPSIFQNQSRNSITLGGFIEQKSFNPATSSSSTPCQSPSVSHEAELATARQPMRMTASPGTQGSTSNASSVNGSVAKSAAPSQAQSQSYASQPVHGQLSTCRVSYSKVTSGAWQNSQKNKVHHSLTKVHLCAFNSSLLVH